MEVLRDAFATDSRAGPAVVCARARRSFGRRGINDTDPRARLRYTTAVSSDMNRRAAADGGGGQFGLDVPAAPGSRRSAFMKTLEATPTA
jgi:hypothetical protein